MKKFLATLSAAIDFKSRAARRAICSAAFKAVGIFANLVKRQTA